MRPVRLDLDGFASFREPAHLDLADVDYFALVGNTGSGKSTLIDAMTFALYGTAHRWEHASSVRHALAPTANRATVSLIFDVAGQRYQVVREVRRAPGSGNVTQRAARLERFLDPTACPVPGEETATESLAAEVRQVTPAVERLLGLDFADFCQCVVLPQGQFAAFLKAKPADRQDILLKLLGASHYERIGRAAGVRARDARQRVEVREQQLGRLAHASDEALSAARAREQELAALVAAVPGLVAPVLEADEQARRADATAEDDARAAEALAGVVAPAGLDERTGAERALRREVEGLTAEADAALRTLRDAEAALEAGPRRHLLDQAARDHARHREVAADLDRVATAVEAAVADERAAAGAAARARDDLARAREADDVAASAHAVATDAVLRLRARLGLLDDLRAPEGLAEGAAAVDAATAAVGAARDRADRARAALDELEARPPAPRPDEVDDARSAVAASADLAVAATAAREAAQAAQQRSGEAAGRLARLEADAADAVRRADEARTAARAESLRPALVVGHACPVCEQQVTVLPPSSDAVAVLAAADDEARVAGELAAAARAAASTAAAEATSAEHRHQAALDALERARGLASASVARLAERCGLPPAGSDEPDDLSRTLDAVAEAGRAAGERREALVADRAGAESDLVETGAAADRARTAVRAAHVALVTAHLRVGAGADGAPAHPGDHADDPAAVVAGWSALTEWATEDARRLRDDALPAAEAAEVDARDAHAAASRRRVVGEEAAEQSAGAATTTAVRAAELRARHEALGAALADLDRALAGAPAETDLPALLAEADRLADGHRAARERHRDVDLRLQAARDSWQGALAHVAADRDALTRARDRVAAWQPPAFTGAQLDDDLAGCWSELAAWGAEGATARRAAASDTARDAEEHRAAGVSARAGLREAFDALDLDGAAAAGTPLRAETLAELALGEARRDAAALAADVEAAASTRAAIEADTVTAQVADQLRTLMRSDRFPEWLATAALDTLVTGASESLRQLSDGQFSLVHEGGDFFVVDHFDADSTRTVKTLSGGETFQASLALALALSEQLATLAAGGTSRLESIFLDEGFGTLDPESLDMVAATLENLSRGNRLVGIVTHVAALAERTPTRFRVTNDQRTSRVEPEPVG